METQVSKRNYHSDGYEIVVDQSIYQLNNVLLKVWFGKRFYITRAKNVKQTIDSLGKQIRTGKNKGGIDEANLLYHVVAHVKRARVLNGVCELVGQYDTPLELIKAEQILLDQYPSNYECLNNNEQAYVPIGNQFLSEKEKVTFLKWYEKRIK